MQDKKDTERKHSRPWTAEETSKLLELVSEDDMTFREIGAILGRSKNSCIGYINRYIAKLEADRHAARR
jgi:transposase